MDIIGKDSFDRPIRPGDNIEITMKIYNMDETDYALVKLTGIVELFKEDPRTHLPFKKPVWGVAGFDHRGEVDQFVILDFDFDDPLIQIKKI